MKIKLEPINDTNREAVLTLTVREDQPFVAQNDYSIGFYRRCGFSEEKSIIDYPDGSVVRYNCILNK